MRKILIEVVYLVCMLRIPLRILLVKAIRKLPFPAACSMPIR